MYDQVDIGALDRASTLHPFTPLRAFSNGELGGPRIMTGGQGVRVRDAEGREVLDGFAGLYCVNAGYGRTEIADAISKQAHQLAYYHTYAGHTNEPLAILSDRLVKMAPGDMDKVFYGLSGSDANETNAKLVWYYNNLRGKPCKKRIISRERGYHGSSVISGSMTGMSFYHDNMDLPFDIVLRTGVPHHYWGGNDAETEREFSARRAQELEELILREDPETIGAFIAEPVLGTGGITPPPEGYWAAIQEVLRRYDILLIVDEVITAFGRTGAMFGSDLYEIEPDLITTAKGLTSAYVPMSASLVSRKMTEVFEAHSDEVGPFSHGYTYSGHPLAAAAALASLDVVEKDDLPNNAKVVGSYLNDRLHDAFDQHPIVGEVRGVGLMAALEFVADREVRRRFDPGLAVGARVSRACLERGLIVRVMPHGDILGFAPPLVATKEDVDQMVEITQAAVAEVTNQLSQEGLF